jgi:hypothetical protein
MFHQDICVTRDRKDHEVNLPAVQSKSESPFAKYIKAHRGPVGKSTPVVKTARTMCAAPTGLYRILEVRSAGATLLDRARGTVLLAHKGATIEVVATGFPICARRGAVVSLQLHTETNDRGVVFSTATQVMPASDSMPAPWLHAIDPEWVPDGRAYSEFLGIVDSLLPMCRDLIHEALRRDQDLQAFMDVPASADHHHAYAGGLFAHVLEMLRSAQSLCRLYAADFNLAAAAVVIHDIGKIHSYVLDGNRQNGVGFSHAHDQCGHERISIDLLRVAQRRVNMSDDIADRLVNIIVGRPVPRGAGRPWRKSLESEILSMCDQVSAAASIRGYRGCGL